MKYFEVTFTTTPCNETVTDVVSALAGEIGFESFVECENGATVSINKVTDTTVNAMCFVKSFKTSVN